MTSYARARAHGPVDRDRTCLLQISLEPQLHTSEFEIVRALSREFMSGLRRGGIRLVTAASEQIQLLLLAPNTKGLNCWLTGGRADGRADGIRAADHLNHLVGWRSCAESWRLRLSTLPHVLRSPIAVIVFPLFSTLFFLETRSIAVL